MNKLDVNKARDARVFLGVVLAVLLLSVSGWAACTTVSNTDYITCTGNPALSCRTLTSGNEIYYGCYTTDFGGSWVSQTKACYTYQNCSVSVSLSGDRCVATVTTCGTQCEADSLVCVNAGNVWHDDASASCGKSCKINHCTAADTTWLSTSIAACTGSNNYAIVNTDSTCEHVGTCCPNDYIPSGNTCKWRCDSVLTTCNGRMGQLLGGVLLDTVSSLSDTVIVNKCYYNCSHSPNADSSVYLVEGNIVLGGPNDSIPDGIKSQSTFNSVRTETGGVYVYDYLTPAASEYIDSIAAMKCVEHLWRCVINSKYVYWYDNQEVPAGCTNIVRVK